MLSQEIFWINFNSPPLSWAFSGSFRQDISQISTWEVFYLACGAAGPRIAYSVV